MARRPRRPPVSAGLKARQSLVWTALPNGYAADGGSLRLSVLLSPRLDPRTHPQRLDSFPEWVNWPRTLQQARFAVSCNGATVAISGSSTGPTNVLDNRLGLADSATWSALFTPALFVRPYAFNDLSDHSVISYDTSAVTEIVQGLYGGLAAQAGDDMPLVSDYFESRPWNTLMAAVAHLDAPPSEIGAPAQPGSTIASTPPTSLTTLQAFKTFHTPLSAPLPLTARRRNDDPRISATWQEYNRATMPKLEDIAPQLDFHQIVSAMGSYPKLLRLLGLVVDILIDPKAFTQGNDVALSVAVSFPPGILATTRSADGAPVTRTLLSATAFEAVSDPGAAYPLKGRLLDLDPARFNLLQTDVDGAGLKLMNFARTLLRREHAGATVDPVTRQQDQAGAPSLRTAGLMLAQRQRSAWLSSRFTANKLGNAALEQQMGAASAGSSSSSSSSSGGPAALALHAEDLLRGYRFDVWDSTTSAWASLCRRTAQYAIGDAPVLVDATPEEESTLRLAATTSADPTSNANIVSLHEAMLTWNGWSLAAPPPGRDILPDGSVDKSQDQSEAEVPPGLKFTSRFQPVKGSLPRLRFGRKYWMRARAVDLAGNSLDFRPSDFGGENAAANAAPFLRFEPVAAPIFALISQGGAIEAPGPGESIARMAIRSYNDTSADNSTPTTEQAHRAAAPPRVNARDAEQHGMLDKGGRVDASTFAMLALERDLDGHDPLAVVREELLQTEGPLGSAPVPTTFAVYEIGRAMTYLPDPLAAEVAVRIFNHPQIDPATIITIPLYPDGAWPDARPFVVQLYEDASAAPSFDAASRQLLVPLQKAGRAIVRMSMKLRDAALSIMGVFAWLDAAAQAAQQQRARDGQHWMLTPWRELEVVHAVQRPLKTPDIATISILERKPGDTSARPMILAQCSVASTDRLDLRSDSHEPTDSQVGPADLERIDLAFQVKITDPTTYATLLDGSPDGGFPDHTLAGADLVGINAVSQSHLTDKAQEFHDTRYRRIEYWFDATSRFREFLPTSLLTVPDPSGPIPTDQYIKVTGARSVTWIPSSAPPPAPQVLYVLPTFAWMRDQDGAGNAVSERRGGLRVYLGRPWNVSGYGEMLAIMLPSPGFTGDPETSPAGHPLKNYVTQWGADPVWDSPIVSGIAPRQSDFPLARTAADPQGAWLPPEAPQTESDQPPGDFTVSGLTPPGLAPTDVTLDCAPHDVAWNDERQLWYCDIELDPGACYYPFIRLALARYQPVSIAGAYLSNIVLADFVALTVARWLAVATTADPRSRQVTVSGHTYRESSGSLEAGRTPGSVAVAKTSVVDVWVEQLDPRLGEDFGWLRLETATVTPGAAPGTDQSEVLWSGQITIPEITNGLGPCRLVVAEYEEYIVDDDMPYQPPPKRKDRRMVFVEHHVLDL
jgi:hypothetical protein